MKPSAKLFLLLGGVAGLFGPVNSFSARPSQFDDFKGDGYYWYKREPEVKPEEKPKPVPPPAPTPAPAKQETKALSAEWFRVNMPKLLDAAIDDPSKENVANYMYAQRVLLDKSQNFSSVVKEVVAMDPFLDENNRVPIAQFAQPAFERGISSAKTAALDYLGSQAGLWVFVDDPEKCSACEGYVNNILVGSRANKGIALLHNFDFRKINVRTPEGSAAAKRLGLKVTPTTMLVIPPKGYYLVSQGLMSQPGLADRLLIAAKTGGHLPKEYIERTNPYNKGVLSTDEMSGLEANKDPAEVIKSMRDRIKGIQ